MDFLVKDRFYVELVLKTPKTLHKANKNANCCCKKQLKNAEKYEWRLPKIRFIIIVSLFDLQNAYTFIF
jgi:hypothetical protein